MKRTIAGIIVGFAVAFALTANSHTPCDYPEFRPTCRYTMVTEIDGSVEYKYICTYD